MYARGIRGAITLRANTKEEIETAVTELIHEIITLNSVRKEDIAFIIFTVTSDINADFPAKYARLRMGFDTVPMMCYREMEVTGSLSKCLRTLVTVNTKKSQKEIKHCYLRNASALRKDL